MWEIHKTIFINIIQPKASVRYLESFRTQQQFKHHSSVQQHFSIGIQNIILLNSMELTILMILALLHQAVGSFTNLIQSSGFENVVMTASDIYAEAFYRKKLILEPDWYNKYDTGPYSQILTLDITNLNKLLDIDYVLQEKMICQMVPTLGLAKHRFSFEYVLAFGITNAIIFMTWNAEVVINISVSGNGTQQINLAGPSIKESNQICFRGETNELSDYRNNIGILVDNITLIMQTRIERIHFIVQPNTNNSNLSQFIAYGNFTVDPQKLSQFDNSTLVYQNQTALADSLFLSNGTILISFYLNVSVEPSSDVEIDLSDVQYLDMDYIFIVFEASLQMAQELTNSAKKSENYTNKYDDNSNESSPQANQGSGENQQANLDPFLDFFYSLDYQILLDGFKNLSNAKCIVIGILSTVFLFKFINFANLMILYIFLDIGLLEGTVRTIFEAFATYLLKDGVFSSLYLMGFGEYPSFFQVPIQAPNKIPLHQIHSGSSYWIIEPTNNAVNLCLEDVTFILFIGLKILLVYWIIDWRSNNEEIRQNRPYLKVKLIKAFYVQIIGVAPVWMLSVGITISYSQIASISSTLFIQKINHLALLCLPMVLLGFIVGWRIIKLRTKGQKSTHQDKRIEKIQRLEIIRKRKLLISETNMQWLDIINYAFFGFVIGCFSTTAALSIITSFKIISWYYLVKKMRKNQFYISCLIRKIIQSIIHLGFLSLFVIEQAFVNNDPLKFQKVTKYISILTLYWYILGCVIQVIFFIIEFFVDLWQMMRLVYKSCQSSQKVQQSSEIHHNRQIKKQNNGQKELSQNKLPQSKKVDKNHPAKHNCTQSDQYKQQKYSQENHKKAKVKKAQDKSHHLQVRNIKSNTQLQIESYDLQVYHPQAKSQYPQSIIH